MRQRTVSYSLLLRVLGGCFLLYGLYMLVLALTASSGYPYEGPTLLVQDTMRVEDFILYGGLFPGNPILPFSRTLNPFGPLTPGPLMWVGLGILCMSLTTTRTSRRAQTAYVGLQIALWMISVSVWSPSLWVLGSTEYGLGAVGPFFLVTLALSLILVALYKPVTYRLTRLGSSPE